MSAVNFLPTEQIQNKQVRKISGKLKVLAACFGALCLAIAIGGTALILVKNNQITALKNEHESLRTQVLAQESTEQTLVLLRDRLEKIKVINEKFRSNAIFLEEKLLIDAFPTTITLKQLDVLDGTSTLSLVAKDSTALREMLDAVKSSPLSKSSIDTIGFNPTAGYQVNFFIQ